MSNWSRILLVASAVSFSSFGYHLPEAIRHTKASSHREAFAALQTDVKELSSEVERQKLSDISRRLYQKSLLMAEDAAIRSANLAEIHRLGGSEKIDPQVFVRMADSLATIEKNIVEGGKESTTWAISSFVIGILSLVVSMIAIEPAILKGRPRKDQ
jgi:hypothetical protein